MSRRLLYAITISVVMVFVAHFALVPSANASEVAVPLSTPRIAGLDLVLLSGQETVKLVSKLGYDAAGKIAGEATIDGVAAAVLGKLSVRRGVFSFSIAVRGIAEKVTMKVEGVVGSGAALVSYSGPKGKVRRVPTPVSLAATLGVFPATFDVTGQEDAKGKIAAAGRFLSGLGNDPPGEGTLKGKIRKGTAIAFRFKSGRQKVSFKGVRQGDFFAGTLKIKAPPAREVVPGFLLPVGFLLRFNPTVAITSFQSDKMRVQIGGVAVLDWSLRGVPSSVTLDPGAVDVTGVLTRSAVPFPVTPQAVDPRAAFKVAARDFVTDSELMELAGVKRIGGPGAGLVDVDLAVSIASLPDGGVFVLGTFSGTVTFGAGEPAATTLAAEGGTDIYLARLSADGTLAFVAHIRSAGGRDAPRAVAALPDGGAVVTGACEGASTFGDDPDPSRNLSFPGGGGLDLFVAGYSGDGRLRFALSGGQPLDESGTGVASYLDGGFLVAGFAPRPGSGNEIAFARAAPGASGTELETTFNVQAGGPGDDQAAAVATFADGSGVVAGFFEGTAAFDGTSLLSRGGRDAFVARIDARGAFTFVNPIGGNGDDVAAAVAAFPDGSILVAGTFRGEVQVGGTTTGESLTAQGGADDSDIFVVRYNQKGDIEFAARAGGDSLDGARGAAVLGDGSAVVAGFFSGTARFGLGAGAVELTAAGGKDAFAARYDARGVLQHAVPAGGAADDEAAAAAAFSDGAMLVAGLFSGRATFGGGEAGETPVAAEGAQDAFLARYEPVNYRLVEVRPEGLAFASVPGLRDDPRQTGQSIAAAVDGSAWVTGSFSGEMVLRDDPDPGRRIVLTAVGDLDAFLAHVLPDGTVDVARQAGDPTGDDAGLGVAALPDGGAVVTGRCKGQAVFAPGVTLSAAGGTDMFLARYRADGSLVFAIRGGGQGVDEGASVALIPGDDEILVTGSVDSDFALDFPGTVGTVNVAARTRSLDIFVARYASDGSPIFVLLAGGGRNDRGAGITAASDQTLWVTGQLDSASPPVAFDQRFEAPFPLSLSAQGLQGFLAHYSRDGTLLAAGAFGGAGSDLGAGIAATLDGGVLVTGQFTGEGTFGDPPGQDETLTSAGGLDVFVARFRSDASLAYAKRAGGVRDDEGLGVAALPDGSALVTGAFVADATFGEGTGQVVLSALSNPLISRSQDIFLARFDPVGALAFAKNAGGGGLDTGQGIAALPDGSALITGELGTGTAFLRSGPPSVFGSGEANQTTFDDFSKGMALFIAKYFPYGN